MKKVLILSNNASGFCQFRFELVERLIQEKYKVYISVPYDERVNELTDIGCTFIETLIDRRGKNIFKDFNLYRKYRKIIKNIKPDMVFTYTIKPNLYGGLACKKENVPYVANITGLGSALENKSLLQKLLILSYRKVYSNVKCVFFQNSENMQFFQNNKIAIGKHKLLPGSGVNLKKFKLMDLPNSDKIGFIFIGRIMKEKGIDEYLETAKIIRKKYKNTEFHILGACEEDYKDVLSRLVEKGIIKYHGVQKDVKPYLQKVHCIIHPSFYPEGMSNVCLENAACGRIVITTNRSGCRETVDNEKTGYIVPIKNVNALVNAVEKVIMLSINERKQMGYMARNKVEKEFDRNIVVDKYINEL